MNHYTFSVKKQIVVTVEATDEEAAKEAVLVDLSDGEYSFSFDGALPDIYLLDKEEGK